MYFCYVLCLIEQENGHAKSRTENILLASDPINTDWSLTCRYMYIFEIRCRGSTVAELSKLTYVED